MNPAPVSPSTAAEAGRWGLALSGGGFRASFFHVGVLRRLAEMEILGRLNVISTVSGGSIVGALYLLRLKQAIERAKEGVLTREDYLRVTRDLETDLCQAVSYNLRTRLFALPSRNLAMLCSRFPLGRRMAELYDHRLYGPAKGGGLKLRDLRITMRETDRTIESHNRQGSRHARIPKLVLNATSLNTGKPFTFTAAEVGDPLLGLLRFDEATLVVAYKAVLEEAGSQSDAEIAKKLDWVDDHRESIEARDPSLTQETPTRDRRFRSFHVGWWGAARDWMAGQEKAGDERLARLRTPSSTLVWPVLAALCPPADIGRAREIARLLLSVPLGLLRKAKLAAWFLCEGSPRGKADLDDKANIQRLHEALREIGAPVDQALLSVDPAAVGAFLLDLYYFRSATVFSADAAAALADLRMVDAVAASANFPPVFPPFVVKDLYDPMTADALGLTDGGVYDNQGTTALLEEECTHLVVSDAGGALEQVGSPAGRFSTFGRFISVLMGNIREAQITDLLQRRAANRIAASCQLPATPDTVAAPLVEAIQRLRHRTQLSGLAFFHIAANPRDADREGPVEQALDPHPDADKVAMLRTDLDVFAPEEIDALVYQGYQLCDRYMRGYLPDPARCAPPSACRRLPTAPSRALRETRILSAGAARIGRRFHALSRPMKVGIGAVSFIAAVVAAFLVNGTPAEAGGVLARMAGLGGRGSGVPLIGGLMRGCARFWLHLAHQPLLPTLVLAGLVGGSLLAAPWMRPPVAMRWQGPARAIRALRFRSHFGLELAALGLLGWAEYRWQLLDRLWDAVALHASAVIVGLLLVSGLTLLLAARGTRRVWLRQSVWLLAGAPFLLMLVLTLFAWVSYFFMSPVGRRTRRRKPLFDGEAGDHRTPPRPVTELDPLPETVPVGSG
jgi:predicted acylesterase/phospholipase RssA